MSAARKKRPIKKLTAPVRAAVAAQPGALTAEIRRLIEAARQQVAQAVNAGLTMLYWQIGARIRVDILKEKRAEYGEEIVATLARELTLDYGRSFSAKNLRHMLRFAEAFPSLEIVSTLSRQLAWSHFLEIILCGHHARWAE